MAATETTKELARQLIWEIVRSGFTQLRKTDQGHLYGSGNYRFLLPYSVVHGSASLDLLRELRDKFAIERAKRDANDGPVKPKLPEFEAVANPEDMIRDLRERVERVTAEITETERTVPAVATGVDEGSTPSGLPNGGLMVSDPPGEGGSAGSSPATPATSTDPQREDEETDMAKQTKGWECPDCHQRFKQAGRHPLSCPARGTRSKAEPEAKPERRRRSPVSRPRAHTNGGDPVVEGLDTLKDWSERIKVFETSSADVVAMMRDMHGQLVFYKRERDDLVKWKTQLESLLAPPSKVPRD